MPGIQTAAPTAAQGLQPHRCLDARAAESATERVVCRARAPMCRGLLRQCGRPSRSVRPLLVHPSTQVPHQRPQPPAAARLGRPPLLANEPLLPRDGVGKAAVAVLDHSLEQLAQLHHHLRSRQLPSARKRVRGRHDLPCTNGRHCLRCDHLAQPEVVGQHVRYGALMHVEPSDDRLRKRALGRWLSQPRNFDQVDGEGQRSTVVVCVAVRLVQIQRL